MTRIINNGEACRPLGKGYADPFFAHRSAEWQFNGSTEKVLKNRSGTERITIRRAMAATSLRALASTKALLIGERWSAECESYFKVQFGVASFPWSAKHIMDLVCVCVCVCL